MLAECKLQYLSNSGFLLTTEEGKRVAIDPYLTGNPKAPFGPEKVPPVDLVIVTHAAFDHLGDSFFLARRDQAIVLGDYVVRQLAHDAGLLKEKVKSSAYGATEAYAGIRLKVLQAFHCSFAVDSSGRTITGIPLAFLITTPQGVRIYHAGDTSLYGDMKLIGQLYRPHIGLIPVGAASPQYGKDLPPSEAALAAQWVGCELAVPMHYDDPEDPIDFTAAVKILAPWMEVKVMKPGEEMILSVNKQGSRTAFFLKDP
jgi:L-ascorbate metabolism protein UlaG (beta-lactamase superfamily)